MIEVRDLRLAEPATVGAWTQAIAENMREQDRAEVEAGSGLTPLAALQMSLALSSDAYCILDRGGEPIAMFGVAPHPLPGVGAVWMLGTDGVLREALSVARQTVFYFDKLQERYPLLWNYIDDRNTVSLRWLKWGGFKLLDGKRVTESGHTFSIFARTRYV